METAISLSSPSQEERKRRNEGPKPQHLRHFAKAESTKKKKKDWYRSKTRDLRRRWMTQLHVVCLRDPASGFTLPTPYFRKCHHAHWCVLLRKKNVGETGSDAISTPTAIHGSSRGSWLIIGLC